MRIVSLNHEPEFVLELAVESFSAVAELQIKLKRALVSV
jgi:hypothetical protein